MTFLRRIRIAMTAAAICSLAAVLPAAAAPRQGNCLSDQQIQAEIGSGQIQSWARIRKLAGIPKDYYETSDVQVCLRGGVPYFMVNMVSPKGENFKMVLNAVDGSR
ncbi:MAG TPA: hypothetical protein VHZ56_00575 [Devosia sp.]|jgi:hypothetical protein|nr:hypothetical protein [Devosia sp.]